MGGNTKVWFIVGSIAFILVVVALSDMIGINVISGNTNYEVQSINYANPFETIGFFINLMSISSTFNFVGIILITLSAGVLWAIVELIRGV